MKKPPVQWIASILICAILFTPALGFAAKAPAAAKSEPAVADSADVATLRTRAESLRRSIDVTTSKINASTESNVLPDLYTYRAEQKAELARALILLKQALQPDTPIDELDLSAEKRPKQEAIEDYAAIQRLFPNYQHLDRVYLARANEHGDLGELDERMKLMRELVAKFPKSQHWAEAQYLIGVDLLERGKQAGAAFNEFKKIPEEPLTPFTALARYKMGWCQINLGMFTEAMTSFADVLKMRGRIKLSDAPEEYRRTDIAEEALVSAVWPFTELEPKDRAKLGVTDAIEYFRNLAYDRRSFEAVLPRLGRRLVMKNFKSEAASAYALHLQVATNWRSAFDSAVRYYELFKDGSGIGAVDSKVVTSLSKLAHRIQAMPVASDLSKKAHDDLEIMVRDFATSIHKKAKESGRPELLAEAVRGYDAYLWAFKAAPERAGLIVNLAEALYTSNRYARAGLEYEYAATVQKAKNKRLEFMRSAMDAYLNALKDSSKLSSLEKLQARTGLRASGEEILATSKDRSVIASANFNIAKSYYDEKLFDLTKTKCREFVTTYPTHPLAGQAVAMLLDAYYQQQKFGELESEGRRILALKNLPEGVRATLRQTISQAQMRNVRSIAGDFGSKNYTEEFMKLATDNKGSAIGEKALLEAFSSLKSQNDPRAFDAGAVFIKQYPKSTQAHDVAIDMGKMAILSADYRRAAFAFEFYGSRFPKDPEAKGLMTQAAQIYEKSGDLGKSAEIYGTVKNVEARCRSLELGQQWPGLSECGRAAGGWKGAYWQGLAAFRTGQVKAARSLLTEASRASTNGLNGYELDRVMHANYLVYQIDFNSYEALRFDPSKPLPSIQAKKAAFESLSGSLQAISQIGSGRWASASLYAAGQLNMGFVKFLTDAVPPKALPPAAAAQFKAGLKTQAETFRKVAKETFDRCVAESEKARIYSQFVIGCKTQGKAAINERTEMEARVASVETRSPEIDALRKEVYRQPRDLSLLLRLADLHTQARDYSMARLILERAKEIAASDARPLSRAAVVAVYLNDFSLAAEYLEQATKLSDRDPTALWLQAGLAKNFGYEESLKVSLQAAQRAGAPQGPVHPLMSAVMR